MNPCAVILIFLAIVHFVTATSAEANTGMESFGEMGSFGGVKEWNGRRYEQGIQRRKRDIGGSSIT